MEKFRQKIIKGTKKFKITSLVLVILLLLITYIGLGYNKKDSYILNNKPSKETKILINKLNFKGKEKNIINFNERYAQATYEKNGKLVSHIIDLEKGKEINYKKLIKDEKNFNKKIHELLLKVYPSKIVAILEDSPANYDFRIHDLYITYDISNSTLNTKKDFYLIVDYNEIYKYLDFNVELNDTYENMDGYNYDPGKLTIALSFDDGPNGERTKKLIAALEDYKMSATFFMLGSRYESNADIVSLVYNSHSEVGYHNYNHTYYTTEKPEQIKNEFALADAAFYKITNDHIKLTRPPYGSYNKDTIESLETPLIRWNLDTNDWKYKDIEYIKSYVLDNLSDGSIVLMHDSYNTSVDAAIELMEILYLMDVQVVSVTTLSQIEGVELEPHNVYYSIKK